MSARRLVTILRDVPDGARERYRRAWSTLRAAVEAAGANAWAFSSAAGDGKMIEFLEYGEGADPRRDPRVAAALAALDREIAGTTDEWEEAG